MRASDLAAGDLVVVRGSLAVGRVLAPGLAACTVEVRLPGDPRRGNEESWGTGRMSRANRALATRAGWPPGEGRAREDVS